jgi:hypothetical protein
MQEHFVWFDGEWHDMTLDSARRPSENFKQPLNSIVLTRKASALPLWSSNKAMVLYF